MNIGIIGCGAIAQYLLETLKGQEDDQLKVTSLLVRHQDKYAAIAKEYGVKLHRDLHSFLEDPTDIVVEAATVEAVQQYLPEVLQKKDAIVISIGAFVEEGFLEDIQSLAEKEGRTIYLPSGAIGGLDLLQHAQAVNGLDQVTLVTRKPAHTLVDEGLKEEQVIFEGSAREAIGKFPKNINVAIVLSLAGIGMEATRVKIIADPGVTKNIHQIEAAGSFGSMTLKVTNNALPSNPKTSYLAALSVLNTLKSLSRAIKIG